MAIRFPPVEMWTMKDAPADVRALAGEGTPCGGDHSGWILRIPKVVWELYGIPDFIYEGTPFAPCSIERESAEATTENLQVGDVVVWGCHS